MIEAVVAVAAVSFLGLWQKQWHLQQQLQPVLGFCWGCVVCTHPSCCAGIVAAVCLGVCMRCVGVVHALRIRQAGVVWGVCFHVVLDVGLKAAPICLTICVRDRAKPAWAMRTVCASFLCSDGLRGMY